MVIQSKKVWLADQFVPAAIELNDGRITAILPYGTKDVDDDYGDKRIVPGFMDIHSPRVKSGKATAAQLLSIDNSPNSARQHHSAKS